MLVRLSEDWYLNLDHVTEVRFEREAAGDVAVVTGHFPDEEHGVRATRWVMADPDEVATLRAALAAVVVGARAYRTAEGAR